MGWEHELEDIIERSTRIPTFQQWLTTIDYRELSCTSPVGMRSLMITLYRRYQKQYRHML